MEVHHHSSSENHKSHKWSHYLWEFFMLFLAVTLGFFVENQREKYLEHHREKQFIQSLVNDIKVDTSRLNTLITNRLAREQRLDSLTFLLNGTERNNLTAEIYFFAVTVARTNTIRFLPNDGTLLQLKNSGAFRLIRTRKAADSIAKYDVSSRFLVQQNGLEESLIQDYRADASRIFNALVFDKMLDEDNNVSRIVGEQPALLNFNQGDLDTWNYRLFAIKALNKAIRRDARLFLKQAINLLNTLNQEYGIE